MNEVISSSFLLCSQKTQHQTKLSKVMDISVTGYASKTTAAKSIGPPLVSHRGTGIFNIWFLKGLTEQRELCFGAFTGSQ